MEFSERVVQKWTDNLLDLSWIGALGEVGSLPAAEAGRAHSELCQTYLTSGRARRLCIDTLDHCHRDFWLQIGSLCCEPIAQLRALPA